MKMLYKKILISTISIAGTLMACSIHENKASKISNSKTISCDKSHKITLLIHGGAGSTVEKERMLRRPVMKKILIEGHAMLKNGVNSLDVVQMAVQEMEDSGAFNAGKGAIANKEGVVELDASIMNGKTLKVGSIAGVRNIKNPILAARKVMDESENVMFVGEGAENFSRKHKLKPITQKYFINFKSKTKSREKVHGTVGAVAMDSCGNLAAATSTGGWEEKIPGRVGDSPIIGAGTYASNDSAAVSATGHGEYFIRWTVAHDIAARVKYQGLNALKASQSVIDELKTQGGEGGVIVIDHTGNSAFSFNSEQMSRGYIRHNGEYAIAFDKDFEVSK